MYVLNICQIFVMSSPRKDQAQGSEHTEQAPGPDPTVKGTHQTGQALGSSDIMEQVQGTHQASGASTPEYESVSDDMEPPEVILFSLNLRYVTIPDSLLHYRHCCLCMLTTL